MPVSEFDGGNDPYPVGSIIPWVGSPDDVPYGWEYCDGDTGTPDLRDRFIKCVSSNSTDPGATGGQHTFSMSIGQLSAHSHGGQTGTSNNHNHSISRSSSRNLDRAFSHSTGGVFGTPDLTITSSTNGGHDHLISSETSAGSGNSINNRPLFFEVGYIQKQQIE